MNSELNIASCLTPPGTGAIAVLALRGPRAWAAVRALFRPELPDTVIAVASGGNVDAVFFAQVLERFGR